MSELGSHPKDPAEKREHGLDVCAPLVLRQLHVLHHDQHRQADVAGWFMQTSGEAAERLHLAGESQNRTSRLQMNAKEVHQARIRLVQVWFRHGGWTEDAIRTTMLEQERWITIVKATSAAAVSLSLTLSLSLSQIGRASCRERV